MNLLISIILAVSPPPVAPTQSEPIIYSDPIVISQPIELIKTIESTHKEVEPLKPLGPKAPYERPAIPGNDYDAGNCTWYVKSKRPDLPNNLGNANTWGINAQAWGWDYSSTPRVGSVAVDEAIGDYGHVAIVENVSGDSVTISEMNWNGLGVVSTRTVPASMYKYIY